MERFLRKQPLASFYGYSLTYGTRILLQRDGENFWDITAGSGRAKCVCLGTTGATGSCGWQVR